MKILLLTQYFPPEFGACAGRNSEHAAYWASEGHAVEVCTGFPNYPDGIVHEGYRGRLFMREDKDGYTINRSWIYTTPNRTVWKRACASLSFMVSAFLGGLFLCKRPDVVIASSGPFFAGPLGYLLSVFKRAPFVFEVRDILPQQAVDVGMIKNRWLIKVLYAVEEFLYRRARGIVTVADASRQSIVGRGFDAAKCFTVENGVREDFFEPSEKNNALRQEFGWEGKFIVLYIGAHGVSQGLFTLLEAAERLQGHENILFVFVGDGADKPALMAYAEDHGLGNVEFQPLQKKERMPLYYGASDVCLVPLKKGGYFRINIPSKIVEILASQRPIVLGAEGQARKIVEESGGGIAVTPEAAEEYAEAILRLYNEPALGESLGEKGRAYVREHFTRRKKAAEYIDILEGLVDERSG